ncbi:unnamed protein product [Caretta caretta]
MSSASKWKSPVTPGQLPTHLPATHLVTSDGKIKVVYLPKKTMSEIQLMDGGIIAAFKKQYRRRLLREILVTRNTGYVTFLTSFTLKDMIYLAADARSSIHSGNVKNIWNKTLGPSLQTVNQDAEVLQLENNNNEQLLSDVRMLHLLHGVENPEAVVKDWLHVDDECAVTTMLTDEDIVDKALGA